LTPATEDASDALAWLDRYQGGGIDGVVPRAVSFGTSPAGAALLFVRLVATRAAEGD